MVQSSLNILGSYAVAAFTAGSKIDNIFTQAFVAIGTTMSTYGAQNVGARKLDRVRQGFRCLQGSEEPGRRNDSQDRLQG